MIKNHLKKIIVVGASGAGKTTLAKQFAEKFSIPHIQLDNIVWLPGWKLRPEEEFLSLAKKELEKPAWVICGNYTRLMPLTWSQADTVVWLDYPLWLCLWRAVKRAARLLWTKEPICNGNVETIGNFFSKNGILRWVFQSHKNRKNLMPEHMKNQKYKHITFIHLRSPQETKQWLESL